VTTRVWVGLGARRGPDGVEREREKMRSAFTASPGPVDLVAWGSTLLSAYGLQRVLRSGYSGPCCQVIRSSDSQAADIPFVAGVFDEAALIEHCTGTDGYLSIAYDHGVEGRHLTAVAGERPKIYDSATGTVKVGGFIAPQWDGSDDVLERADACGLTGNPDIDTFDVAIISSFAGPSGRVGIGGTGSGEQINVEQDTTTDEPQSFRFSGGNQVFTNLADETAALYSYHARREAGDQYGDGRMWFSDSELSEISSTNPTNTPTLTDTKTTWGTRTDGSSPSHKQSCELLIFSGLSLADAAIIRANQVAYYGA